MRKFLDFLQTTAVGGLLVIVPVAIVLFVLGQLLFGLYKISAATVVQLGIEINDALLLAGIALASLIALCFVTGLLVQTRLGIYLGRWSNRHIGRRIPMFNAIRSLTKRFVGLDGKQFSPVEIDLYDSEARLIGFLVETLPKQRCVVFVPSAPVATVGNIYVISRAKVSPVSASVADTLGAVTQWGVDTRKLYSGIKSGTDDAAASG